MRVKCLIFLSTIVAFVLTATVVNADSTTVRIDDVSSGPGTIVEVAINIAEADNVGSLDILLTYDPAVLGINNVDKGALTQNSLIESNTEIAGIIAIGIASSDGIKGEGSVAVVLFEVLGELGDTSPLTLETVEANDATTFIDIPVTKTSGTFTVEEKGAAGLSWTVIGIVIAVVVVLAAAGLLIIRRKQTATG